MKILKRVLYAVIIFLFADFCIPLPVQGLSFPASGAQRVLSAAVFMIAFICVITHPAEDLRRERALRELGKGCELLRLFLISAALTCVYQIAVAVRVFAVMLPWHGGSGTVLLRWVCVLLFSVLAESVVFWAGMIRLYTTSVQLGIKHRVLAVFAAWIPGVNIWYLLKLIRIAETEEKIEADKIDADSARSLSEICRTAYPVLLVHGVFFRDFRYLNYWGRIPAALKKNGATVFYGEQESASSVEESGKELAERIRSIVKETGCGKVNIIAHSKGGLDCRAAISHYGAAPFTASLTTINTPHRGCIFAEYLLSRIPEAVRNSMAGAYNAALKKLGDRSPDFICAVNDLTPSACRMRNENTPDMPGVLYESVMSYCRKAASGRFPLNVSYPLVKHFDGKNDGLVSLDSAEWGTHFTLIGPPERRGISHADMIDLNRENIPGFDVREFYVSLVANLKNRGF